MDGYKFVLVKRVGVKTIEMICVFDEEYDADFALELLEKTNPDNDYALEGVPFKEG